MARSMCLAAKHGLSKEADEHIRKVKFRQKTDSEYAELPIAGLCFYLKENGFYDTSAKIARRTIEEHYMESISGSWVSAALLVMMDVDPGFEDIRPKHSTFRKKLEKITSPYSKFYSYMDDIEEEGLENGIGRFI